MAEIRSKENIQAEFLKFGSWALGTVAPLVHKGTQISTKLIQKGSRASVTKTGTVLHFSPTFANTPKIFLQVAGAAVGTQAYMKNLHTAGGTVSLNFAGTKVVDFFAMDPSL